MSDEIHVDETGKQAPGVNASSNPRAYQRKALAIKALALLLVFALGGGGGYMLGRRSMHEAAPTTAAQNQDDQMAYMKEVNPSGGYEFGAVFGDIGMQLVAAGAIDLTKLSTLYQRQNKPLSNDVMDLLTKESGAEVVINQENAPFLLNFFWALGLTNQNSILSDGPMMSGGTDNVGGYASTGGWTLGTKQATELYSSTRIIPLTDEQQARLLEVASAVYRPCCDNPTHFPDCNHGMAMLGLLELMASRNASSDEMFKAAKYANSFWYPQQMLEVATAFRALKNVNYTQADPQQVVSRQYSSLTGFRSVHQWLSQNGLIEQAPSSGGSCGVQ